MFEERFKADLEEKIESNFDSYVSDLKKLCSFATISAQKDHEDDFKQAQEFILSKLKELGFDDAHLVYAEKELAEYKNNPEAAETIPHPMILAKKIIDPNLPTVTLYSHYDVVPTNNLSSWNTDPFKPEVIDNTLYARGASDDKYAVIANLAALEVLKDNLPVNICVFFEGEEEIGSIGALEILKEEKYKEYLNSDLVIITDFDLKENGAPSLYVTTRSVGSMLVTVQTGEKLLHSGDFGGPIPEPNYLLAKITTALFDENGDFAVKGLNKFTLPENFELTEFKGISKDEDFKESAGLLDSVKLIGNDSIGDRIFNKPACTLIGYDLPDSKSASATIYPSVSALYNLRFAPDQDVREGFELIKKYIESLDLNGAKVSVELLEAAPGSITDLQDERILKFIDVLEHSSDKKICITGAGGAVGVITQFRDSFKDAVVLPVGGASFEPNMHGVNEFIKLEDFKSTILRQACLIRYSLDILKKN